MRWLVRVAVSATLNFLRASRASRQREGKTGASKRESSYLLRDYVGTLILQGIWQNHGLPY